MALEVVEGFVTMTIDHGQLQSLRCFVHDKSMMEQLAVVTMMMMVRNNQCVYHSSNDDSFVHEFDYCWWCRSSMTHNSIAVAMPMVRTMSMVSHAPAHLHQTQCIAVGAGAGADDVLPVTSTLLSN